MAVRPWFTVSTIVSYYPVTMGRHLLISNMGKVSARSWTRPLDACEIMTFSAEFQPGYQIPEHSHNWHQLIFASSGVMTVRTSEGCWVAPSNRAVWVPGGVVHAIEMSGQVKMRTLYIRPAISDSLPLKCSVMNVSPLLRELILQATRIGVLNGEVESHARFARVIIDQLDATPAAPLQLPIPTDPRALRVARLLMDEPGNNSPLQDLLKQSGASKRTIERLFLNETGMTFARWRQQLRLLHGLRLLARGDSVTSVAVDVGYESTSAFISAFKKIMGTTPRLYHSSPTGK